MPSTPRSIRRLARGTSVALLAGAALIGAAPASADAATLTGSADCTNPANPNVTVQGTGFTPGTLPTVQFDTASGRAAFSYSIGDNGELNFTNQSSELPLTVTVFDDANFNTLPDAGEVLADPLTLECAPVAPPAADPQTKDDCKQGGFRDFDDRFKAQGSCIGFVERNND